MKENLLKQFQVSVWCEKGHRINVFSDSTKLTQSFKVFINTETFLLKTFHINYKRAFKRQWGDFKLEHSEMLEASDFFLPS